jgi:predicted ATPase
MKQRRVLLGMTQEQLAQFVACSVSLIRKYETGERRPPRATLERLADALQISSGRREAFITLGLTNSPPPPTAPALRRYPGYVPASTTPLFGRSADLDELTRRLLDPSTRLLSLIGPPGVGKSRLALECARRLSDAFDDGICLVELAPVAAAQHVPAAIARALGEPLSTATPVEAHIAAALGERRILLILDNVEHVLPAARLFADLLAACPQLRLLVTSRVPLRLRAERRYRVEPLAVYTPDHIASADSAAATAAILAVPSVQMFIERAQAVASTWMIDATTAPLAAAICSRLDGLPLAIELAAARCDVLELSDLLQALSRPIVALTEGPYDLPPHQQTLYAAIDWSYRLLTAEEQRSFRLFSVFRGGCTPAAAAALGLTALEGLQRKGLIQRREAGSGFRYLQLEVIRDFALTQIMGTAEYGAALQAHAAYFAQYAAEVGPHLYMAAGVAVTAQLDADLLNIEAAIGSSLAADGLVAAQLVATLGVYWQRRGFYTSIAPVGDLLLSEPNLLPPTVRALAAYHLGFILSQTVDHWRVAPDLLQLALRLAREAADASRIAEALVALAMIARYPGNQEYVLDLLSEAMQIAETLGTPYPAGSVHEQLTKLYLELGDPVRARRHSSAAQALAEAAAKPLRQLRNRIDEGAIALMLGDPASARAIYQAVIAQSHQLGDRYVCGEGLGGLALVEALSDQREAALHACTEALATLQTIRAEASRLPIACVAAYLAAQQGDHHSAEQSFAAILRDSCAILYIDPVGCSIAGMAWITSLNGDDGAAARLLGAGDGVTSCFQLRPTLLHAHLRERVVVRLGARRDLHELRLQAELRTRARLPRVAFTTSRAALEHIDLLGAIHAGFADQAP